MYFVLTVVKNTKISNSLLKKNRFFQADDDSFIFMENLRNMLSHFNSSEPLIAGAMWACRGNGDCADWQDSNRTDEVSRAEADIHVKRSQADVSVLARCTCREVRAMSSAGRPSGGSVRGTTSPAGRGTMEPRTWRCLAVC